MQKHDLTSAAGLALDGWKLVPLEPTGVMKDCGAGCLPLAAAKPWASGDCYRAMLAAAPQPPTAALKPIGVVESAIPSAKGFHVRLADGMDMPEVGTRLYTKAAWAENATLNDWHARGFLAATLTCWHRLTGAEADELVALYQSLIVQRQAAIPTSEQGGA